LKNQEELEFDDTKIKGQLKGTDKKAAELKEQLEKAESKLRTSMRSKDGKVEENEEEEVVARRKNSDDEEDEFFDRTKKYQFKN
jgi:hypothetical protein